MTSAILKDDKALEEYLLDKALGEAVLTYANGDTYQGADLATEAAWLREAWLNVKRLAGEGPTHLLEQAAIAGALSADHANTAAERAALAARLAAISAAVRARLGGGWRRARPDHAPHGARSGRLAHGGSRRPAQCRSPLAVRTPGRLTHAKFERAGHAEAGP